MVPLYPEEGYVELDPEALWKSFIFVVKGAVKGTRGLSQTPVEYRNRSQSYWNPVLHNIDAGVQMYQMEALGVSTQRATFTTWDR